MGEILIENGYIATMNKNRTVYKEGSILIEDDLITDIGDNVRPSRSPEQVIDAHHKVILPGFVNAHSHLLQYFRGVYELIGDFYKVNLPLEGYRRPEDMDWLGPASCAEYIHAGCTTAMVVYTYPHGFAESARASRR